MRDYNVLGHVETHEETMLRLCLIIMYLITNMWNHWVNTAEAVFDYKEFDHKYVDTRAERQTDGRTDRQAGRLAGKQASKTDRQADKQTDRQAS